MHNGRGLLPLVLGISSFLCLPMISAAQEFVRDQGPSRTISNPSPRREQRGIRRPQLRSSVRFRFDIVDMVTNHQFDGQKNSFHISYEYVSVLKSAPFDPKGHHVPADMFPYFQDVRQEIIDYINSYPAKSDFYEIFGLNICKHVLLSYPQIKRIEMTIDIPAFKDVDSNRGETIVMSR